MILKDFSALKSKMRFYSPKDISFFIKIFNKSIPVFFAAVLVLTLVFTGRAQTDETAQNEAVKLFNAAQDAHEKGDYREAVKLYDQALKYAPEFPEIEFQKGSAHLALGETALAEKSFRRAVEIRPEWTLPMVSLSSILIAADNFAEAEKILNKAISLDDKNYPAYVALTELRLKSKASPAVLKELLATLRILSAKANLPAAVWVSRASLERVLGETAAARNSVGRAVAIEPQNKSALLEQIEIAILESDFDGALKTSRTLLQLFPKAADVNFLQARLLASTGNAVEALKVLDSIENKTPEIERLRAAVAAGTSVNASELENQLAKDGKNAVLLGRLCKILRTENPSKALEYCRRASEAEPENINHAVGFGAALVQAKQYENAVTIFRNLLRIAPDNSTARANLATALFQSKKYAEAKTEYLWLTEKQPDLTHAYYFLAIVHDNLGEYTDAMANYQQFLKLSDASTDKLEIEKVNLRLPSLQKQIKSKKGTVSKIK